MQKKWAILTYSSIKFDSRLKRQINFFNGKKIDYNLISVEPFGSKPLYANHFLIHAKDFSLKSKVQIALRGFIALLSQSFAEKFEFFTGYHQQALKILNQTKPTHLYINDWATLLVAVKYKNEINKKIIIIYDSHEWARGEMQHNLLWSVLVTPYIRSIEDKYTPYCSEIITVSAGLAQLYGSHLPHHPKVNVIRNLPDYEDMSQVNLMQSPLKLLYHGIFHHGRGLELLIESLPLVKHPCHLTLRGYGKESYIEDLKTLALKLNVSDKVTFLNAVSPEDIVKAASKHDIGFFTPNLSTEQINYALPNKLFEYCMAGLMVISSKGKDSDSILKTYKFGVSLPLVTATSLGDSINSLSFEVINRYKSNALIASHHLHWGEEVKLLEALIKNEDINI